MFRDCDSPTPLPQHGVNLAAYGVAPAFLPAPVLDCSSNEYGNGGGFIPPVRGRTPSHGWLSAHVRERACPPQTHRTWYRSLLAPLPLPLFLPTQLQRVTLHVLVDSPRVSPWPGMPLHEQSFDCASTWSLLRPPTCSLCWQIWSCVSRFEEGRVHMTPPCVSRI